MCIQLSYLTNANTDHFLSFSQGGTLKIPDIIEICEVTKTVRG